MPPTAPHSKQVPLFRCFIASQSRLPPTNALSFHLQHHRASRSDLLTAVYARCQNSIINQILNTYTRYSSSVSTLSTPPLATFVIEPSTITNSSTPRTLSAASPAASPSTHDHFKPMEMPASLHSKRAGVTPLHRTITTRGRERPQTPTPHQPSDQPPRQHHDHMMKKATAM